MSVQLRLRRGTRTDHEAFTGAEGEITYVTDEPSLRVHDGSTIGGHTVAGGMPDAPVDGTVYGRRDGGWVEVTGGDGAATAASTSYDHAASGLAATDVQAALDELDAAKLEDAPADGRAYVRVDGTWAEDSQATPTIAVLDEGLSLTTALASLDFVGAGVAANDDGEGHVTVTVDAAGTAASTSYDNTTSGLAASDVQAALDEIEARTSAAVTAVIAGADAAQDVKDATDYVEGTANIETVIAQALADGYRSLLLAGTCAASNPVDIDTGDEVDLWSAPGASLAGDLTVSVAGARVRLDVAVTGTITDAQGRITRPTYDGPTSDPSVVAGADRIANVISLSQAEYDGIGTPDAATLYVITG